MVYVYVRVYLCSEYMYVMWYNFIVIVCAYMCSILYDICVCYVVVCFLWLVCVCV